MKRLISIGLAVLLVLTMGLSALAEGVGSEEPMELTVGVTTRLSGYFFTEKWGSNGADIDVRELLHGHNTVAWEQNGSYALNQTVVRELGAHMEGSDKVYRISLNEGLTYNDGTPITAYDYAFSVLLQSSPEFNALGGAPIAMDYIAGYEQYQQSGVFSGVRVIDELTLDIALNGDYLPYFYEITWLNIIPYPISQIAPGCEVADDGNGAYIDGDFTSELLEETVMGEGGYLYSPKVTAGPYSLVSYDKETGEAVFARNANYAGNFEGVVPTIEKITVVYTDAKSALEKIQDGTLDLVNKVAEGEVITEGMALSSELTISMQSYLRSGFSFISFSCELGATQSVNVRKALAACIDAGEIAAEFTKGLGTAVYGYYGMGQWMAMANQEALAQYARELNPDEALQLLIEDGWVLNEKGEGFDSENDSVRYKLNAQGEMEALRLKWAQPENSAMSELLTEKVTEYAQAVGIELVIEKLPFDELLSHYYRQTEREYNMFSLATNFNLAFDPYYTYHTGDEYQGEANKTGLADEELMNLALAMRQTEVGDDAAYVEKWLEFQQRWNELQPMIPLYSNIYFDFYRTDLQSYNANAYMSWATAIVYSYIGEAPEDDELGIEGINDGESGDDLTTLD